MDNMTLQLFSYHSWATSTLIQHLRKLPLKDYQKETQSVFPTVAAVAQHIYDVVTNAGLAYKEQVLYASQFFICMILTQLIKTITILSLESS